MASTFSKNLANSENDIKVGSFKNQWLNFSLYFPQFLYKTKRKIQKSNVCAFFINNPNRLKDNNNDLGGGESNNKFLANGDNYQTEFIEVDKEDFVAMFTHFTNQKGFNSEDLNTKGHQIKGNYKSESNSNGNLDNNTKKYFYRGLWSADSFKLLLNKNII